MDSNEELSSAAYDLIGRFRLIDTALRLLPEYKTCEINCYGFAMGGYDKAVKRVEFKELNENIDDLTSVCIKREILYDWFYPESGSEEKEEQEEEQEEK